MPNAADIIARRLHEAGIRHAFGMPGGEVLALVDALDRAGIGFVLAKHENAAGFMAEGVWHATGAPALLVATVGPGMANCVNVVANAQQDRVPLVLITGRVDPAEAESYTHQVFDHQAVLRPLVKGTFQAASGGIDRMVDRALVLAMDGQPGPVHIDLPISVAEGQEPDAAPFRRAPVAPAAPATGVELDAARALLAGARRPLVLAGVDALNQGAEVDVAAFCRRFSAPLLTTYKAKGILPETAPLSLGGAGLSPKADAVLKPLVAEADLVVLAGYDPIEMRINWRDPFPAGVPVIEFSAVPPLHQMHAATHLFCGHVGAGLAALAEGIVPATAWPVGRIDSVRQALTTAFAPEPVWGPGRVFETVRRLAPPETVVTVDSGAHRILVSQMWAAPAPRRMLQSTGLCTMGCALPLALGYKFARPDVPVIAFVGDAGLEMVLGELATARDLALGVIVVVLVDRKLALIDLKQRAMNLKQVAVSFGDTDFPAVARALGGFGVRVETVGALEEAFVSALEQPKRFTVIAAAIDDNAYAGRL